MSAKWLVKDWACSGSTPEGRPCITTTSGERYIRVTRGRDKVEATVDSCVWDSFLPCNVHLLFQEFLILLVDVFFNGLPAKRAGGGGEE